MREVSLLSRVALVRGERDSITVEKAIELAGGFNELTDRPVLIKVNFISAKTWETGATTDPVVVEGIIRALKPVNENIAVAESDATFTNCEKAARLTGMKRLCERYNIPFINLRRIKEKVKVKIPNPETLSEVNLPKMVFDSYIISAAKLKTHGDTIVTLGLKNMFGLLPDKLKAKYHMRNIHRVVVDLNKIIQAKFTVIDGFIGMEGKGPVHGKPVKMDLVITGKDPVATDAVAAMVMGFDYNNIYHIRRLSELGIGNAADIEIIGENLEKIKRRFTPP